MFVFFSAVFITITMPQTPSPRVTRSNSNTHSINLQDIKSLIESSKAEILASISSQIEKVTESISLLAERIGNVEVKQSELSERCRMLEESMNGCKMEKEEIINETGSQEIFHHFKCTGMSNGFSYAKDGT